MTVSGFKKSVSQPPYSVEMTYLPSEKAPAPASPSMMAQDGHLTHLSTFLATMGQVRFSMLWPFSMIHTERAGSRSVRRQAVISPPMPPPMMAMS